MRIQKRVSHRALLEFLNLLQCSCFPGRRENGDGWKGLKIAFWFFMGFGKKAAGCVLPLSPLAARISHNTMNGSLRSGWLAPSRHVSWASV